MELDLKPGQAVIDHGAPKHRCPICHHVCFFSPKKQKSDRVGRPTTTAPLIRLVLRTFASAYRPMPTEDLARRLGVKKVSLPALIYRARKSGLDIRHVVGGGYYLHGPE